jgi:hypothetical protein
MLSDDATPPDLVPGRQSRNWMDAFASRHPYRCLPLNMANTTGWEILCPFGFTAEWNGGPQQADIVITPDRPHADAEPFRDLALLARGPDHASAVSVPHAAGLGDAVLGRPNHVKDGIQPLVGLIETDWLPFPFTMNWIFTRPGRIKFEKGEPFCFITLLSTRRSRPSSRSSGRWNPTRSCRASSRPGTASAPTSTPGSPRAIPDAAKEAWQRFYFKGELPEDLGNAPASHSNKRRLKSPRIG